MIVVVALTSLVAVKVGLLMQMRATTESREMTVMMVDDQARRVLDQVAYAIMGAGRDRLIPDPEAPLHSTELRFEVSLGVVDGEVVWGDTQAVGIDADSSQLAWRERPDQADERRVVWCNTVRDFLEGEVINGADDNGNGLVDEKGMTFVLEGNRVTILLSLERTDEKGNPVTRTVESVVTCRN
jgi:hypothetical protein